MKTFWNFKQRITDWYVGISKAADHAARVDINGWRQVTMNNYSSGVNVDIAANNAVDQYSIFSNICSQL